MSRAELLRALQILLHARNSRGQLRTDTRTLVRKSIKRLRAYDKDSLLAAAVTRPCEAAEPIVIPLRLPYETSTRLLVVDAARLPAPAQEHQQ